MSDHLSPEIEALIVDALAGDLDAAGRARLEAAIDADPTLADLLDEQAAVASSLSAVVGGLSEFEAATLRRDVLDAVTPTSAPAPAPAVRPWVRWAFSAAAVLVLVVGGIGFLSQGGDDALDLGESAAVTEAATGADARDGELDDAAEAVEESTAQADLAGGSDEDASSEADAAALAPSADATDACPGQMLRLEEVLVFGSADEAIEALSSDARGAFDPRGLEYFSSVESDPTIRVTWVDGDRWAYQALIDPVTDGWEVWSLVVCDG